MRNPRVWAALAMAIVGHGVLGATVPLQAQAARGSLTTTFQYVQVHPFVLDTVAPGGDQVPGCTAPDPCTLYRTGARADALAATQDISLVAWGLGVTGLSVTGLIRSRVQLGGAFDWPRADDRLDAILAYAEFVRTGLRVRGGRQRSNSTLGFAGYDGVSVRVAATDKVRLEGFGGRSLAQTLNRPANEAFRGIEDFVIDQGAYLVGGLAEANLTGATTVAGRYQREIYSDRSALLSERASLTLMSRPWSGKLSVRGRLDYDLGVGDFGKAEVALTLPPLHGWRADVSYRRHVPYFDLSTIWGYFRPVAYDEVGLRLATRYGSGWDVWGSGGVRRYGDSSTTIVFSPLKDMGWRTSWGMGWTPAGEWNVTGSYRLEWGAGGFLNSGEVRLGWNPTPQLGVSLTTSAMEQFEEFRVGEGALLGAGGSARYSFGTRTRVGGGFTAFRRSRSGTPAAFDGTQVRAWSEVRIAIGRDPGVVR